MHLNVLPVLPLETYDNSCTTNSKKHIIVLIMWHYCCGHNSTGEDPWGPDLREDEGGWGRREDWREWGGGRTGERMGEWERTGNDEHIQREAVLISFEGGGGNHVCWAICTGNQVWVQTTWISMDLYLPAITTLQVQFLWSCGNCFLTPSLYAPSRVVDACWVLGNSGMYAKHSSVIFPAFYQG